jgi:hypothetical protein
MDAEWERSGGAAGIAGCIAAGVTFGLIGNPPDATASAAAITTYAQGQRTGLLASGVLVMAAVGLLLWFIASMAGVLRAADRRSPLGLIVLGAGVAMLGMLAWDGLLQTVVVFLAGQGGASANGPAITALYDLQDGLVMPGAFGFFAAVFLGALGLAIVRGHYGRRWAGYLSIVLALPTLIGAILGLTMLTGGSMFPLSFSPAISSILMTLILGVRMLRVPRAALRVDAATA